MAVLVRHILQDIQDELVDQSVTILRIMRALNDGAQAIALGYFPEFNIQEICLPKLETTADATTVSGIADLSALANPYCKRLFSVTYAGQPIEIASSLSQMEQYYPGLADTGTPIFAAMSGDNMYVMPKADATFTIQYFAKPPQLTVTSSVDFLPDFLALPLLKNYVLHQLPTKMLFGLSYDPKEQFGVDIAKLYMSVGAYSEKPQYIHNQVWNAYGDVQ